MIRRCCHRCRTCQAELFLGQFRHELFHFLDTLQSHFGSHFEAHFLVFTSKLSFVRRVPSQVTLELRIRCNLCWPVVEQKSRSILLDRIRTFVLVRRKSIRRTWPELRTRKAVGHPRERVVGHPRERVVVLVNVLTLAPVHRE